jgi:L-glutamine-phosphate cytidylyltransferase
MQAIILAAGAGARMGGYRDGSPKCLYDVGGKTLIAHQLDILFGLGIKTVIIVLGHAADRVREAVNGRATYINNEEYMSTNSLYSFILGASHTSDDVLVLNSDVLVHASVIELVASASGSAFAYDSSSGHEDEHMKVRLDRSLLIEMSKQLPTKDSAGENIGVVRLDRQTVNYALEAGRSIMAQGRRRDWFAAAVNMAAGQFPIRAIDTVGIPWIEIDFLEDLERARRDVWPAIVSYPQPWQPGANGHLVDGLRPANLAL